jgi:phage terminase large subunit-like protein
VRHVIDAYARDVLRGTIPAGKYHRLACARHQRDRDHESTPAFPYRLDLDRADRFLRFGRLLKHYKGEWVGQPIEWQPWQVFTLGSFFGWVHRDTQLRRFRHLYKEVPRKNGKSLESSVIGLYVTFFDGEPGAEGYCAAMKRDQAKIVWGDAKELVQRSGLRSRIRMVTSNLSHALTASKLEPLGADVDSHDGLNPHFVSLDEIHKYKSRAQIDVLETATMSRRQPVINKITTAGDSLQTPCGEEHIYACQILERTLVNEQYFAFIAHADPEDDWTAPETARKANPNYGVSVKAEDLAAKVTKALGMRGAQAAYKQKNLNLWTHAGQPWLSLDGWRKGQTQWTLDEMAQRPCLLGIDLAGKLDLCVLAALFPPIADGQVWRVWFSIWSPGDTLDERAHRDLAPYPLWRDEGHLIAPPGTRVDASVVREAILMLRSRVDILRIGVDPYGAAELIHKLVGPEGDGFDETQVLEVPQTFRGMSGGCHELEGAVLGGLVDAGGNPVAEWAVGNAVVKHGENEQMLPSKRRSRGRIDPVTALGIAWNLAIRERPAEPVADPDLLVV